tara:strand:+ start:96660 stop:98120 length:1461 start_codon:yes stop_codon:yes gene_type:complete
MKMTSMFFILFGLVSCASFKETHTCYQPFNFNGGKFKYCKNIKANRIVLYDIEKEKIMAEGGLKAVSLPKPGIVYFNKIGEVIKFYGDKLSKSEVITGTKGLTDLGFLSKFQSGNNYHLLYKKEGIAIIDRETGNISKNLITKYGDDQNHKARANQTIPGKLEYAFDDILIRYGNWEDRKHLYRYQVYDKDGNPQLKDPVNSKNTSIVLNSGEYLLVKEVDKEEGLVRPVVTGVEDDFYTENNIEGIILLEEETWSTNSVVKGRATLPVFKHFIIVSNKDGKKTYQLSSYTKNYKLSRDQQLVQFREALTPKADNKTQNYNKLVWVESVYNYRNKKDKFFTQKRPLLVASNGKAVIANSKGVPSITYASEKDYYAKTKATKDMYAEYIAAQKRRTELDKSYAESARKRDMEIARQQEEQEQRKRAAREHDARANRAAKDAAWSGVANQIQNAGRASKKKADCIRKRTQTKKDYLDKKQGWYQTGGC